MIYFTLLLFFSTSKRDDDRLVQVPNGDLTMEYCYMCLGDAISGREQCSECTDRSVANSTAIGTFTVVSQAFLTVSACERC